MRRLPWFALLLALPPFGAATPPSDVPDAWKTRAEATSFAATPSYDETLAFLRRLEQREPAIHVTSFGTSGEGRALPLVIVSREHAFTPEAARRKGKPVLLIVCAIHAGEIDGKDAMLILLRDAALGARRELLDAATLLIVPIFNVDGHERVSKYNRPNQDGPADGMGWRTNATGLNLNRDHLKADSPEMRAFLALFNAWRPELHVDNHVTDGCDFLWTLTYTGTEPPQVTPAVGEWLARHLRGAAAAVEAAGFHAGPYVDLVDGRDPSKGFSSLVSSPRLAGGYVALRNRPSILVEMHSYKPYRDRVLANAAFLDGLVREVAQDPKALVGAVAAAERAEVERGRADAPPSDVVLAWEDDKIEDRVRFPVYAWTTTTSVVTGTPVIEYDRSTVREIEVPWYHVTRPGATTPRPRGYLVLPGWPQIEERLRVHGLVVRRLTAPAELDVEELRVSKPRYGRQSYQGHTTVEADVERRAVRQALPAGTLWIPADQPDFDVAAQLLEPGSPDSLFAFGELSTVLERKEYIDERVLEGLVRDRLKDPAVTFEWQKALADPEFAKDTRARFDWWYRRTPYWDGTVGRLPIFRSMKPLTLPTTHWR